MFVLGKLARHLCLQSTFLVYYITSYNLNITIADFIAMKY